MIKSRWGKQQKMNKITEEQKRQMKLMRRKGYSYAKIAVRFNVCSNTVQYHLDPIQKKKIKERAIRNQKPRGPRTDYMRNYMMKRRKTDPEFAERLRGHVRKSQRKRRENK